MSHLHVIASVTARIGKEEELIAAIRPCVVSSRQETGCLAYEFYKDISHDRTFVFIETWADKDAFEHHATLPHFLDMVAKAKPLMDGGFTVQKLEKIG